MSQNPDAVANQGEFAGHVKPSEPLEKGGHQPGRLVGNDAHPTFNAQTLPPGTAPPSSTHAPNPPLNNQKMYQDASSTLTGATSSDVHKGLGHPGQGQTSSELHEAGSKGHGLAGLAHGVENTGAGEGVGSIKDLPAHAAQRNLGDVPTGQRGNTGGPPAEERENVKIGGV
ncbi:hypothetical protein IAQ61_005231 [Plenodomus lingam]|nr:hypothetical protein IAQ61_005231 [Plenodomus lingam]